MKVPDIFVPEKNLEVNIKRLLKESRKPVVAPLEYSGFDVIRGADTYAQGIAKLKEQGRKPFTFFENVGARIADYEANGENSELFGTWLDSVTGIVYKAKSTKFKIILRSDKLENIPQDFDQSFIPIDYNAEKGIEFDSKKGEYDRLLTRKEVKNHKFWIAVMGGDKKKLARYVDFWFDRKKVKEGMGVYLRSNTDSDELRALVLGSGDYSSDADGFSLLDYFARFASGAQRK
ncbi:hypothetical protein FJZ53_00570 [Candidatus Woesearchaeota archaeon]|nr:hypothetical protein [Candidatus Woesearchaeota archaeon]